MSGMRYDVYALMDERGGLVDGLYRNEQEAEAALKDYRSRSRSASAYRVGKVDPGTVEMLMAQGWEVTL